jgi:hypothetical protein
MVLCYGTRPQTLSLRILRRRRCSHQPARKCRRSYADASAHNSGQWETSASLQHYWLRCGGPRSGATRGQNFLHATITVDGTPAYMWRLSGARARWKAASTRNEERVQGTPQVFEGFRHHMYKKYSGDTFLNFNTNFAFTDRARARLQIHM